ncbi:MAG TPA: hypothetical protein PLH57_11665, partial [Oligoflexia bacterium]|nr:hypothetical protein [Oligoflexia bacterium]
MDKYRFDCIHFRGYKPCAKKKVCWDCGEYSKIQKKILIIKLGALGDVMRTTPVLYAIERQNPGSHVTWVTKKNAKDMLERTPRIHRLVYVDDPDNGALLRLMVEKFDEVHCYDKEDAAIGLAALVKAERRYGFEMNEWGHMAPINKASQYSFDLGLSDEMKFVTNTKTYQELTYESSEFPIPSKMDHYDLQLAEADRSMANTLLNRHGFIGKKNGGARPLIGLNTGSGRVFQTKQW